MATKITPMKLTPADLADLAAVQARAAEQGEGDLDKTAAVRRALAVAKVASEAAWTKSKGRMHRSHVTRSHVSTLLDRAPHQAPPSVG